MCCRCIWGRIMRVLFVVFWVDWVVLLKSLCGVFCRGMICCCVWFFGGWYFVVMFWLFWYRCGCWGRSIFCRSFGNSVCWSRGFFSVLMSISGSCLGFWRCVCWRRLVGWRRRCSRCGCSFSSGFWLRFRRWGSFCSSIWSVLLGRYCWCMYGM